MRKILLILIVLLLAGGVGTQAAELKNYVYWWPLFLTPWAYKAETQLGGVGFMKYQRDTDFEKLSSQFKEMVETHKPDAMVVISDWRDWQPLSKHTSGYKLGEGNNQLKDIRKDQLTFDYFDDLLSLAKTNGIKLFLYPVVSAYGGQVA